MTKPLISSILMGLIFCLQSASAADFSDPTWPCIQRKVERLSVGLMWPNPIEPVTLPRDLEAAVSDLAGRMELRRIEVEDLDSAVADFVAAHGREPALLGHVFESAFDRMARTRTRLMDGIADFSLKQIALSQSIEDTRAQMATLMDAATPDYDKIDALEEKLDWEERIFTDRQRALTYVCETPVLLEKRLYAIAQLLLAQVEP